MAIGLHDYQHRNMGCMALLNIMCEHNTHMTIGDTTRQHNNMNEIHRVDAELTFGDSWVKCEKIQIQSQFHAF